jgi:hypothetical protein
MKKIEFNFNQYIMVLACLKYAGENQDTTDLIPEFSSGIDATAAKIELVSALLASQQENTTGTAEKKRMNKLTLALALLAVTNPVSGYAARIKDTELRKAIKKSKSAYMRMKPDFLIAEATRVVTIITPLLPSIIATGVTGASLEAINSAKANLIPYAGKPRSKTVQKKQYLTDMVNLLGEAMDIVRDQLDPLSTGFTSIDKQFYLNGWNFSRKLITYGTFHTRASIDVFMGDANAPVNHAVCTIENTPLKGETNAQGHVNIPYVPFKEPQYVIVTAPGFPNPVRTGPYYFEKGKSTNITVNMTEFSVPAPVNKKSNANA